MKTSFKKMFRLVKVSSEWRRWYKRTKSRGYRRATRDAIRRGFEDIIHIPDGVRLDAYDVG